MDEQAWDDAKFCREYEQTWEISLNETHYGWLASGENTLELLKNENIAQANVLDVGCGLGQNLVALCKQGARGFGLDISENMLAKASNIVNSNNLATKISLQQGDMRDFTAFSDIEFNIILSVYSMEYLSSIQELRTVIHNLYKRLKHGGVFIMCFSHQSQYIRYPDLMNKSVPCGVGRYRTFNFSFKDATEALIKAGFSIERIVEQQTKNPSQITYEDAKQYPYHFREGFSPFLQKYDEISNNSPHTIIYVARRMYDPTYGIPKQQSLNVGFRELWGYKRKISKYSSISYLGHLFNAIHLAKRDNVLGLVDVLTFNVNDKDISKDLKDIILEMDNTSDEITISANSVLGLIHSHMYDAGIKPIYKVFSVDSGEADNKEKRVFIESVIGLGQMVASEFDSNKLGLLTFVNGHEPSKGELPLDVIKAKKGDFIQVLYLAYTENKKAIDTKQNSLF